MEVLEKTGAIANPTAVADALISIGDEKTIERLALAVIDDLKKLCDHYKNVGHDEFERNALPGTRGCIARILKGNPNAGTYVGVGLGEHFLNFGFLSQPVVEFLFKRFKEEALGDVVKCSSSYCTTIGEVHTSATEFRTKDGTFWFDNSYAWFIRRRVD